MNAGSAVVDREYLSVGRKRVRVIRKDGPPLFPTRVWLLVTDSTAHNRGKQIDVPPTYRLDDIPGASQPASVPVPVEVYIPDRQGRPESKEAAAMPSKSDEAVEQFADALVEEKVLSRAVGLVESCSSQPALQAARALEQVSQARQVVLRAIDQRLAVLRANVAPPTNQQPSPESSDALLERMIEWQRCDLDAEQEYARLIEQMGTQEGCRDEQARERFLAFSKMQASETARVRRLAEWSISVQNAKQPVAERLIEACQDLDHVADVLVAELARKPKRPRVLQALEARRLEILAASGLTGYERLPYLVWAEAGPLIGGWSVVECRVAIVWLERRTAQRTGKLGPWNATPVCGHDVLVGALHARLETLRQQAEHATLDWSWFDKRFPDVAAASPIGAPIDVGPGDQQAAEQRIARALPGLFGIELAPMTDGTAPAEPIRWLVFTEEDETRGTVMAGDVMLALAEAAPRHPNGEVQVVPWVSATLEQQLDAEAWDALQVDDLEPSRPTLEPTMAQRVIKSAGYLRHDLLNDLLGDMHDREAIERLLHDVREEASRTGNDPSAIAACRVAAAAVDERWRTVIQQQNAMMETPHEPDGDDLDLCHACGQPHSALVHEVDEFSDLEAERAYQGGRMAGQQGLGADANPFDLEARPDLHDQWRVGRELEIVPVTVEQVGRQLEELAARGLLEEDGPAAEPSGDWTDDEDASDAREMAIQGMSEFSGFFADAQDERDGFDDDDDASDVDWIDVDEASRFGCLFPGRCCMPGMHTTGECHTAEQAAEYENLEQAEAGKENLPDFDECPAPAADPSYGPLEPLPADEQDGSDVLPSDLDAILDLDGEQLDDALLAMGMEPEDAEQESRNGVQDALAYRAAWDYEGDAQPPALTALRALLPDGDVFAPPRTEDDGEPAAPPGEETPGLSGWLRARYPEDDDQERHRVADLIARVLRSFATVRALLTTEATSVEDAEALLAWEKRDGGRNRPSVLKLLEGRVNALAENRTERRTRGMARAALSEQMSSTSGAGQVTSAQPTDPRFVMVRGLLGRSPAEEQAIDSLIDEMCQAEARAQAIRAKLLWRGIRIE